MDRTLKGELYARAHRKALEHFTDSSNEEALDELTQEYMADEYPDYLQAEQAHLEIALEGEADDESSDDEEESSDDQPNEDDTPDEDVAG